MILSCLNRGLICYCRAHGTIGEEEFGADIAVVRRSNYHYFSNFSIAS